MTYGGDGVKLDWLNHFEGTMYDFEVIEMELCWLIEVWKLSWKKKVVGGLKVNVCCESEVVRKKRDQPWKLEGTLYLSTFHRSKH